MYYARFVFKQELSILACILNWKKYLHYEAIYVSLSVSVSVCRIAGSRDFVNQQYMKRQTGSSYNFIKQNYDCEN